MPSLSIFVATESFAIESVRSLAMKYHLLLSKGDPLADALRLPRPGWFRHTCVTLHLCAIRFYSYWLVDGWLTGGSLFALHRVGFASFKAHHGDTSFALRTTTALQSSAHVAGGCPFFRDGMLVVSEVSEDVASNANHDSRVDSTTEDNRLRITFYGWAGCCVATAGVLLTCLRHW